MKLPSLKKLAIWTLLPGFVTVLAVGGWLLLAVSNLPEVDFLSDPGATLRVNVPDWQGNYHPFIVGPRNQDWVPLQDIPADLRNAVLSGEDFSFYSHNGFDWYELYATIKRNFREHRFARGASTLTQQLAKNLFLSRDKTLKRKVKELVLTRRMEKTLSKDRILELYLNVVELGDLVYGVGAGALHHFGKRPDELSLRECTFLAAMLPGPKVYDPDRNMDRIMNRSEHLLGVMLKGRMITEDQYLAALVEIPFSGESAVTADNEPDPGSGSGSVVDFTPEMGEGSVPYEEQFPTDLPTGEFDPQAAEGSSPPREDEPIPDAQMRPALSGSAAEDREMLTTQDGIIEIPIKNN
jgi:monofunctional biosynthetic peptidoglycan transglycosylase